MSRLAGTTGCALLDQPTSRDQFPEAPSIEAKSARRLVLAAVMMATFMAAMESSIVATAMPTIVAELGGFHLFSWAFAAYLLPQAVTIPIYGLVDDAGTSKSTNVRLTRQKP